MPHQLSDRNICIFCGCSLKSIKGFGHACKDDSTSIESRRFRAKDGREYHYIDGVRIIKDNVALKKGRAMPTNTIFISTTPDTSYSACLFHTNEASSEGIYSYCEGPFVLSDINKSEKLLIYSASGKLAEPQRLIVRITSGSNCTDKGTLIYLDADTPVDKFAQSGSEIQINVEVNVERYNYIAHLIPLIEPNRLSILASFEVPTPPDCESEFVWDTDEIGGLSSAPLELRSFSIRFSGAKSGRSAKHSEHT